MLFGAIAALASYLPARRAAASTLPKRYDTSDHGSTPMLLAVTTVSRQAAREPKQQAG